MGVKDTGTHVDFSADRRREGKIGKIVRTRGLCGGRPCFLGTRIWPGIVLGLMKHGIADEEILLDYPSLTFDDLKAARHWKIERKNAPHPVVVMRYNLYPGTNDTLRFPRSTKKMRKMRENTESPAYWHLKWEDADAEAFERYVMEAFDQKKCGVLENTSPCA